jgi:hypothetical protein
MFQPCSCGGNLFIEMTTSGHAFRQKTPSPHTTSKGPNGRKARDENRINKGNGSKRLVFHLNYERYVRPGRARRIGR